MDSFRIQDLPSAGYYLPNFITEDEQDTILAELRRIPQSRWTVLSHRRLLSLPSRLTGTASDTLLEALLPSFLVKPVLQRLEDLKTFSDSPHGRPNHVLVNEYQPCEGIMPHEDGPAYHPITATVSLGGHTVLEVYKKNEKGEREAKATWRILQEARSLFVTTGEMYKDTLHGISEINVDTELDAGHIANWSMINHSIFEIGKAERQTRVSLTYRDVLKVAKLGGALKFMNKR